METGVSGLVPQTSDIRSALRAGVDGFPFRCELSLAPLIAFWARAAGDPSAKGALARIVGEEVRRAPELLETIEDFSVIERHRELVDVLMTAVFPPTT
jgi:hypothetical protein